MFKLSFLLYFRTMQHIRKRSDGIVVPSDICLGFNSAHIATRKANSPVATFARCSTYSSTLVIPSKIVNTYHPILSISLSSELERVLMIE